MQWAIDETVVTSDECFREYRHANWTRRRRWEDLVREWQVCANIGVRVFSLVGGLYQENGDKRLYMREQALEMAYATYISSCSPGESSRIAFANWATTLVEFLAFPLVNVAVKSGDKQWTVASEIGLLPWWASLGHPTGLVVTTERPVVDWKTAHARVQAMLLDRWTTERIAEFRS